MATVNSRKRRRYGAELKAQILAECDEPGASVATVRHPVRDALRAAVELSGQLRRRAACLDQLDHLSAELRWIRGLGDQHVGHPQPRAGRDDPGGRRGSTYSAQACVTEATTTLTRAGTAGIPEYNCFSRSGNWLPFVACSPLAPVGYKPVHFGGSLQASRCLLLHSRRHKEPPRCGILRVS